ncbi:class I SAM-dependent methyltransferase [Methylobacterium sp. J-092]|uniref:class I SAM-dependent methyltransferase n=1 Tax=Methylobacterium sp. J-092 TaxID=2836667 RepID=UPI001FB99288|nr:class I SAM-dependent methyltransferase [Methylobacterium sp. J-092]MCJ2010417.1 class I SAM-dependent methyltransferase [Methylobacterium sp. J-092]
MPYIFEQNGSFRDRDGRLYLSATEATSASPEFDGQINSPESPHIIKFFSDNYMPIIKMAGINQSDARILEIGAGLGALAYGTLSTFTPLSYVATDIFPILIDEMSNNLSKWSRSETCAALLDPNDRLSFEFNYFNIIQSHSVFHHVADYRTAIANLFDRLRTPGVLIIAEPSADGYALLCMLVRSMQLHNIYAPEKFSELYLNTLKKLVNNLADRLSHANDVNYLRKYGHGDKHIFSVYDLVDLACSLKARLHIQREHRSFFGGTRFQLTSRSANELDIRLTEELIRNLEPVGVQNAVFNDMRIIAAFIKS